jgi:hypothetical protein
LFWNPDAAPGFFSWHDKRGSRKEMAPTYPEIGNKEGESIGIIRRLHH